MLILMTAEQKKKIVSVARSLIGKPYLYGATPENVPNAFDCSSFTQYVFGQIGIELPRSAILQAADPHGKEIEIHLNFQNLETGDLLFMRSDRGHYHDELFDGREMDIGHIVLYVGDGIIIHAQSKKGGVVEEPLKEFVLQPHYSVVLIKRFE